MSRSIVIDDDGAPTIQNPSIGGVTTDNQSVFTVDVSDNDGINAGGFSVDIGDDTGLTTSADGVSYSSSAGELTIDPSGADVSDYPEGSVTATVTAEDTNGLTDTQSFSFTVDSEPPTLTFTQPTDGGSLNSASDITVDIADATTGPDTTTIDATLNGQTLSELSNTEVDDDDASDGIEYASGTLTISPGEANIPSLQQGSNTISVTAADSQGTSATEEISFEFDDVSPTVENIDVSEAPINNSDATEDQLITVTFNEDMDTSVTPEINIDTDGDGQASDESTSDQDIATLKEGIDNNGFGKDNGFNSEARTYNAVISSADFPADSNQTLNFVVTNANDVSGNALDTSADTGSIYVDTNSPTATADADTAIPDNIRGTIDVTEYFTVDSNGEGADEQLDVVYTYDEENDGDAGVYDDVIQNPETFDTTVLNETAVDFKVQVTDDVGNTQTANTEGVAGINVDNADPSVSASVSDGHVFAGDLTVSDIFNVQKGTYESITFEADVDGDSTLEEAGTDNTFTETQISVSDGTEFTATATVTGDASVTQDPSASVDVVVDDADDLGVATTEQDNGDVKITLTPEPGATLQSTTVTATQNDGSAEITLDESDFTEKQDRFGDYYYEATISNAPDGSYDVDVDSFTDNADRTQENIDVTDPAVIDNTQPGIENAYVTDADGDSMQITVVFNESVTGAAAADFAVDGTAADGIGGETDGDDTLTLTINRNIQTGDAPPVTVTGTVSEEYDGANEAASDDVADDDNTGLHSLQATLDEGLNSFSVPAASGGFSATELEDADGFQSVWYYDATSGEWVNWVPADGSDAAPFIEGGEGYLVEMSQQSTVDINVNTQPGLDDPFPTAQTLDEGWNLVGHYQEGAQEATTGTNDAFDSIAGNYETDSIYAQNGANPVAYEILPGDGDRDIKPGEAYWVRITADDVSYTEEPMTSAPGPIAQIA
ncbi:hypothetical protein [Halorubrum sp. SP9]|uniref:beta strand repeat-containing protein n=2 Tax=unclassified Halorubrum TaxID=2642239 RepID=UPI001F5400BA|nr:hypothetical protein [Halorubrum sp. SP9]